MLSFRRHRYALLGVVLTLLVLYYLATGKQSTRNSEFYRKTAAAIERRRSEGPQAPGPAHKSFLKGGSIRPEQGRQWIDTSPIDDNEDDITNDLKKHTSKNQELDAAIEAFDRQLEDLEAGTAAGATKQDITLERQIIKARRREQEKLREELRTQLKTKEMKRQSTLAHDKLNPDWIGAFEKEPKPPSALSEEELERAPASDPFRDKPAGGAQDTERAPAADPFRDTPADEVYHAPVPIGQGGAQSQEHLEQKIEQQEVKLAKEQVYLDPARPPGSEQFASSGDDAQIRLHRPDDQEPHTIADSKNSKTRIDPETGRQIVGMPLSGSAVSTEDLTAPPAPVPGSAKNEQPAAPPLKTAADVELSRLLALSPVVIFSKTHCPYSKKAKRILTQNIQIMPAPYVVELDTHERGAELQTLLKERTGRGTVPNIMIDGQSLGGGDDVESLFERGELRDVIKQLGGRRIVSITKGQLGAI